MKNIDNRDYHLARARVRALRGFYSHLSAYIIVNLTLLIINLITTPQNLWFQWVAIFWGIGLAFHAIDAYTFKGSYLGTDWETRKVGEFMEEEQKRKAG